MCHNPLDYDTFALLRTRCKTITKNAYSAYVSSTEESLNTNIKAFWNFVHSKKSHRGIPLTMTLGTELTSDTQEICELFSKHFSSVFEDPSFTSNILERSVDPICYNYTLASIKINELGVLSKLKHLDWRKGPGYDNIPPLFFFKCADEICRPITMLFNKSLEAGVFPIMWKIANIVPIFKSGDRADCTNYRPISILSCVSKIFESVIYDYLYYQVKPFISDKQHGFIKKDQLSQICWNIRITFVKFLPRVDRSTLYTQILKRLLTK